MKERKKIRLPEYDYGQNGCYFVTVCTQDKAWYFGRPNDVGAAPCGRPDAAAPCGRPDAAAPCGRPDAAAPCGRPDPAAELAERWLLKIEDKYPGVKIDKYVVMPNHIHAMIRIGNSEAGGHAGPPLPQIMDWYKTMTTNQYMRLVRQGQLPPFRKKLWQRSYHDHIIRDENDFLNHWNYIESNPARWAEDEYYCGKSSMP